jgi:hypothetical protein
MKVNIPPAIRFLLISLMTLALLLALHFWLGIASSIKEPTVGWVGAYLIYLIQIGSLFTSLYLLDWLIFVRRIRVSNTSRAHKNIVNFLRVVLLCSLMIIFSSRLYGDPLPDLIKFILLVTLVPALIAIWHQ